MLLTKENILDALRNVEDPDLKKDLVTLGMIEDLEIDGLTIKFSVVLTTPACPLKDMLENACRNAIKHFVNKEAEIIINMTSRVTSAPQVLSKNIKNIIVVASGKRGSWEIYSSSKLSIRIKFKRR